MRNYARGALALLAQLRVCGARACAEYKVLPKGASSGHLAFEPNLRLSGQGTAPGSEPMAELRRCLHNTSAHAIFPRHCKSSEECALNAGFAFTQQNKLRGINESHFFNQDNKAAAGTFVTKRAAIIKLKCD